MLSEQEKIKLYSDAMKASKFSYSPYSRYPVGAAVLTKSKKIFLGTNVENASYGLTICAERTAIVNAIVNNHKDIVAVAVFSKKGEASPCGACRQFIYEFGMNIEIIYKRKSKIVSVTIDKLIPSAFTRKELK